VAVSDLTAASLTIRLERVSSAALRSGAAPTAIARLVESAAVASTHALALELLDREGVQSDPASAEEPLPAATALRLAA
jgi:hypothetical protein